MEGKREGTDHFADIKHQATKYKKAKEIQSCQTSTTSASIVHLPTIFLGTAGQSKKQDRHRYPTRS